MANLLNRNIQVSRGKESECDSLSSGERTGSSPNHRIYPDGVEGPTLTREVNSLTALESATIKGDSPVNEIYNLRRRYPE